MSKIIAVNALSGGGKTTVVKALLEKVPNSKALFFDDRDYDLESGIDDIGKWIDDGADVSKWNLDLLEQDIVRLKEENPDFIFLDYPFGKRHCKIASYIDVSIFIDTPLDLVLCRRLLRDFAGELEAMKNDLEYYQEKGRDYFVMSRETALQDADFVIDGSGKVDEVTGDVMRHLH